MLKYDFKDFEDWEKYDHLSIEVDDVEDENLLGEFERTGSWIESGLKNGKDGRKGGVLVHWYVSIFYNSSRAILPLKHLGITSGPNILFGIPGKQVYRTGL